MLPAILAQLGLPYLIRLVSSGLGQIDTPVTQAAAQALATVGTAIDSGDVSAASVAEANRHVERMAEIDAGEDSTTISEVNATIWAEVASGDAYVRRMRPTFGYIMAVTWAAQMGAIAYTIVAVPAMAGPVIDAMSSLSMIWSVGLSVLGIYVYKRSQEKQGKAADNLPVVLSPLVSALKRR